MLDYFWKIVNKFFIINVKIFILKMFPVYAIFIHELSREHSPGCLSKCWLLLNIVYAAIFEKPKANGSRTDIITL